MAVFIKQDDKRSDLQKRLSAELSGRGKKQNLDLISDPTDVENSKYIEGTKKTTSLAWVWLLVVVAFIVFLVWLTVSTVSR